MTESPMRDDMIPPVPRITMQAFCDTAEFAAALEAASADRRMAKAHVRVQTGGAPAAVAAYSQAPTPNVVLLETRLTSLPDFLGQLDALSEVCDAGTKVVVVGHVNDVVFYRELIRRGVSEYLIAPVEPIDLVRAISGLYAAPGAPPVGRTVAVVGAKGGVGASTVAHNLGWSLSRKLALATVIVDLDIAFGTAGLDFNQDPPQGIADAIFAPDRLDSNVVERLLSKCSDKLSLLTAPAVLDRTCDLTETAFDQLIDILRASTPAIVLDVPHVWTAWSRRVLVSSDDVVVVAGPELASLRNAKNLVDLLRQNRPNDKPPRVVINQASVAKRPEIATADFAKAIGVDLSATLPFDAQLFGTAANNGQMVAEIQPGSKAAEAFDALAQDIAGRPAERRARGGLLDPILSKLVRRKAS
ncbi:AAA family ATPase [Salinarimonas ramus]|uniref:Pilus assembly protein n=1 Tax=Salinarimonas ramus TaxID=690164 RepID=A0A917Q7B7_9HYPH|nr:AAA family ATPase [Salinarimonas ramus]GGK32850.1 pilus assembly protein [Salinarimonas ramus]